MFVLLSVLRFAEESQKDQPEHVERGHARGDHGQSPEHLVLLEGVSEDLVLAKEA